MQVIINSPSLDPTLNVSGISAVTQFIIDNNDEVEYIHFEIGRRDNERGGILRVLSILRSLKEWKKLLKSHPDALVLFNFALTSLSTYRDSLYLFCARKRKTIVHLHGGNYLFAETMPRSIGHILCRLFSRDIPFLVLSDKEREHIQERFHAKQIYSLPNCIDLKEARTFVRTHECPELTLGYIGRIAEAKGMNELLKACICLKSERVPFKLIIAGVEREEDRYIERFQKQLGKSFEYMGIVSGELKKTFMMNTDVFMLPTYFEGLPMSLLETMSFGCVPVITNVGSIGTVVQDKENGLFVRVKCVEDLVHAVKLLHTDRKLFFHLSRTAQATIFEQFNPEQYLRKLNAIYQT